jgi:hypothetical protein
VSGVESPSTTRRRPADLIVPVGSVGLLVLMIGLVLASAGKTLGVPRHVYLPAGLRRGPGPVASVRRSGRRRRVRGDGRVLPRRRGGAARRGSERATKYPSPNSRTRDGNLEPPRQHNTPDRDRYQARVDAC